MLDILILIAPVFGLIGLGFLAAKGSILDAGAARVLAMFGYKIAMPALLFRAVASVGEVPVSPVWLALSYVCGIAATWLLAVLGTHFLLRRPPDDAPVFAMGACFSNGVMLGFPLILLALGPEAATPIAFLAVLETALLWTFGTLHMGLVAGRQAQSGARAVAHVLLDVARNPLIVAMAAGFAWRWGGLPIPVAGARFLELLAGAAIPVSLFALGMSLAAYRIRGQWTSVVMLCILKLAVYPALAFWLATEVFHLPRVWAGALVIYVAMPVGANAFIFATRYEKAVASISGAVAVSTVLSVVSVTVTMALLHGTGIILGP
jgi:predicted permease